MLKNLPIILLGFTLLAIVAVSSYTDPRYQDKKNGTGNSAPAASISQDETTHPAYEEKAPKSPPIWRMWIAWPEGVTTLAVLFTLFFIAWQAILMRQSVAGAENASKTELRAYLTVIIGEATYQERRPPDKGGDLMFECRPLVVNTGRTPARKITFKARAAVMPFPLPKETHLPEGTDEGVKGNILGPQQQANMSAVVDGFRPDEEVERIRRGTGDRLLYVWGLVTYEDVFEDKHYTRFCQQIYWDLKDQVRGHYIPGRNDAD